MAKAVVATAFGGPEVLTLTDVDVAEPRMGEVSIAVKAAGVNPSDYKTIAGMFGRNEARLPLRVGNEVSGIITAVGEDAGPFAIGDEVVAYRVAGGWSEEITVAASNVFAKPASLSWDAAAGLLLVGATAAHMLEAAAVAAGDTVLVHGASGSVGLIVSQLATSRGARVIGTASSRNFDLLRRFGIEPVEYGDGLVERVRELSPTVDAVLDTVGTDEAIDASLELVADRARIVSINAFHRADDGIVLLGGGPGADPGTDIRNASRPLLLDLAARGGLEVVMGPSFDLADAQEALTLVQAGHPGGKVVLHP